MPALEARKADFAVRQAQVVGLSVDSVPSHLAWQKHQIGTLSFPLCSDFYPHGAVSARYGLLREGPPFPGISNRAVIIVDKQGKVAWKKVYDLPAMPDVNEILEALKPLA
ncbi:MAG: redoxin domain-containing protein [Acidobacteria bacterium]|nr:redoxin domain-containing protein [Acidobacteriota bacterium]